MQLDESLVSRRKFVALGAVLAAGGVAMTHAQETPPPAGTPADPTSGAAPPTPPVSPAAASPDAITIDTIREAQKLTGVPFDEKERAQMQPELAELVKGYARRREHKLPSGIAPATTFRPASAAASEARVAAEPWHAGDAGPLPERDEDIAYASLRQLSGWLHRRALSSERLTRIYLDRLKRFGSKLECVVTLTEELAFTQARRADAELAAGSSRGPLHGIPWGAKDLFDTAGIRTTWGAEPYRERVPERNAKVVDLLADAGAVLVAKTALGALAYGDIWFGGKTRNPWKLDEGSSGSSAGSAAGVAAGLFGFSLGTETLGSIVSPCMRCGSTGLRPTFGRVSRTGAMPLCWSLDKIGPIGRTVDDTALVLAAIACHDPTDSGSTDHPFVYGGPAPVAGMRVGYNPAWFERGNALDKSIPDKLKALDVELVELELPKWPYRSLLTILSVEAAAAFEELTLSNRDDELSWQAPEAWPNSFRTTWLVPAVELIQAERFRRQVCELLFEKFAGLDAAVSPSYAGGLLTITNFTGQPSLTLRTGFRDDGQPHGITLWGKLYGEAALCRLGTALEAACGCWQRRPALA